MRDDEIIRRASEIVDRHPLPDFVRGFDIVARGTGDDAVLWVIFQVTPGPDHRNAEVERRISEMNALRDAVRPELLDAFEDRFAYFHFHNAAAVPDVVAGQ